MSKDTRNKGELDLGSLVNSYARPAGQLVNNDPLISLYALEQLGEEAGNLAPLYAGIALQFAQKLGDYLSMPNHIDKDGKLREPYQLGADLMRALLDYCSQQAGDYLKRD